VPTPSENLVALVKMRLPLSIENSGVLNDWKVVGPGLIAASTKHVQAIDAIQQRDPSALVQWTLIRSLFEYVATFAWIAGDTRERAKGWLAHEFEQRIKLHNDFVAEGQRPILSEETLESFKAFIDEAAEAMPGLKDRTIKADDEWHVAFDAIADLLPEDYRRLALLYAMFFRNGSRFTHPTSDAVALFVTGRDPLVLGDEQPLERDLSLLACSLLALGLVIASTAVPELNLSVADIRTALGA
jgi:Family of unknown function (DUF5677)